MFLLFLQASDRSPSETHIPTPDISDDVLVPVEIVASRALVNWMDRLKRESSKCSFNQEKLMIVRDEFSKTTPLDSMDDQSLETLSNLNERYFSIHREFREGLDHIFQRHLNEKDLLDQDILGEDFNSQWIPIKAHFKNQYLMYPYRSYWGQVQDAKIDLLKFDETIKVKTNHDSCASIVCTVKIKHLTIGFIFKSKFQQFRHKVHEINPNIIFSTDISEKIPATRFNECSDINAVLNDVFRKSEISSTQRWPNKKRSSIYSCTKGGQSFIAKVLPRETSSIWEAFIHQEAYEEEFLLARSQIFIDPLYILIVMPQYKRDLADFLTKNSAPLEEDQIKIWLLELIQGILALHEKNIVHRDIKLANIFMDEEGTLHLGDYGLCSTPLLEDSTKLSQVCGTPSIIAPEILERKRYDSRVDIYSLGVVLYTILYKKYPFQHNLFDIGNPPQEALEERQNFLSHPMPPSSYSEKLVALCHSMLDPNPNNRPSLEHIAAEIYPDIKEKWDEIYGACDESLTETSD